MDNGRRSIWEILDLEPTGDARSIKRAYARQLKTTRPEENAEAFQQLNDAYQYALRIAAREQAEQQADDHAAPAPTGGPTEPADAAVPESAAAPADATAGAPIDTPVATVIDAPAAPPRPGPRPQQALVASHAPESERPPEAVMTPAERYAIAERLWDQYTTTALVSPRNKLKLLTAQEELHSLMVQEAFEVCAARHCCAADCPPNVREAVVEHFGWHDDYAHLHQLDPQAAQLLMARYRADRSYDLLVQASGSDPAIARLLEERHPRFSTELWLGSFASNMKKHIEAIRRYHPELLHFRLNSEVFGWWEQKTTNKRYYPATLAWSIMAGIVLYVLAAVLLAVRYGGDTNSMGLFASVQLLCIATGVLLAFRPPRRLLAQLRGVRENWLNRFWHVHLYKPVWQYGWMPLFFVFSALMLCYQPQPAAIIIPWVSGGLVLCAVWAGIAAAILFRGANYGFIGIIAAALTLSTPFGDYGPFAALAFWSCVLTAGLRGGEHFYQLLKLSRGTLMAARVVWLAGFAALYLASGKLDDVPLSLMAWCWGFAGLLMVRTSFSSRLIWPGILLLRIVVAAGPHHFNGRMQLPVLLTLMTLITFFMLQNMYYAKTQDLQFS